MSRNAELAGVVRSLAATVRSEQITFLAASLAYYAFVSLLPLLLLVLVVGSAVGGEAFATSVVEQLGAVLSPSGEQLLIDALTSEGGRGGATVFGILVLLWGALKLFRGLDIAFSEVYDTTAELSFLGQLKDAVVALVAVSAGIAVSIAAGAAVTLVQVPLVNLLGTPALAVALTITFLPLYVLMPDANVSVREALPGAVFAAVGWALLGTGFRVYAENAGSFQLYGVVGGVLLLVTWFYFAGIVLLVGGVLNAVLAERHRPAHDRQLQQERHRHRDQRMTDEQGGSLDASRSDREEVAGSADAREDELDRLREELESFEAEIEDRTVHRNEIEGELKRYVRRRVRRGHAAGWGPYLVLLYGTAMTLGAFYLLEGGWAILAMIVVWLSTLGLYALMVVVGLTVTAAGLPGRLREFVGNLRG